MILAIRVLQSLLKCEKITKNVKKMTKDDKTPVKIRRLRLRGERQEKSITMATGDWIEQCAMEG